MAGRILKIKPGYNPNSSSIGSLFSNLLWIASAGAFLTTLFANLRPPPPKGDGQSGEL